jgi:hypothetical protein
VADRELTADGTRVVSATSLETTWTSRVASAPADFPAPTLAAAYAATASVGSLATIAGSECPATLGVRSASIPSRTIWVVGPHLGRYDNSVLGRVSLELSDGMLMLDTGEVRSRTRPQLDEHGRVIAYAATDPPRSRLPLALREDERGTPIQVVPDPAGSNEYILIAKLKATPSVASPSP